jgi:uncharacterized protein DUF4331
MEAQMSDHGDHAAAAHDLTDLYVFGKPGDPAKTIQVMGMNPDVVPGDPPPGAQPFDPGARYDFMIDADGDAVPGSAFRITFSNDGAGRQMGTVRRLAGGDAASSSADGPTVLHHAPVSPATEPLITADGGIAFFAGRRSDPFFEDLVGRRNNFHWTGKDFLAGHNVSAIVLELPNSELGSHPPLGIWARVCAPHGQGEFLQADRAGRPFANVVFNSGDKQAQNTFNQSQLATCAAPFAGPSPACRAIEHSRGFHRLVKRRTGSEGRMSYLKPGYGRTAPTSGTRILRST